MAKFSVIIVDDEQSFWADDYEYLSTRAKQMRFDFKSKKDIISNFKNLISQYEGYWYLLIDANNSTLFSGALDPNDFEDWKENL